MDSDGAEMMVGFPEFWQQAYDVKPAAFQAIKELEPIQVDLLEKYVCDPLHKVTLRLAKITYQSLGALTVLLLNGHGGEGMMVARSMFEASVTIKYL